MAENSAAERSEEATPHRIEKSRGEGKFPQSQEVPTAMMLLALLVLLMLTGPTIYQSLAEQVRDTIISLSDVPTGMGKPEKVFGEKMLSIVPILSPFLIAGGLVSIFSGLIVSGWAVSLKAVKLDISRTNPIKGAKNLFSMKSLVKLLISIAKLSVIGVILWLYLSSRLGLVLSLVSAGPGRIISTTAVLVGGVLVRIILAMSAVALIDLLYQKWNHKKELRMTKQEVKEEMKQYEINPQFKGRIRMLQREMANKRMLGDVATADAIVVNPTHFAVALKYDSNTMNAPEIVAKGADLLCQRIKDIARENNVPIVERPRLARTLYATAKVGETVPETLFVAVAEVLAMIYKLRQNRNAGATS